jgi:hypothetical protein
MSTNKTQHLMSTNKTQLLDVNKQNTTFRCQQTFLIYIVISCIL